MKMPLDINANKLTEHIKECFLQADKYQMHKIITEFKKGDEFLGDYFQFLMYEPHPKAPIIYSTGSPFDVVTRKAPDRALAFQDGELILDFDFTEWVKVRTGAMDALMMQLTRKGVDSKILYYGAGGTAKWSVGILQQLFAGIKTIDYHNASGGKPDFEQATQAVGVTAAYIEQPNLMDYDCIFMHTNAKGTILGPEAINRIKPGALITTYISSTDHGEVADEFYTSDANVILDSDQNVLNAKDLKRAVESGRLTQAEVVYLKDLLGGKKLPAKPYIIARFCGTPMQNLAVMHYVRETGQTGT